MSQRNEIPQIFSGVFLVLGLHIFAITVLSLLAYLIEVFVIKILPIKSFGLLWIYPVSGIGISQLLYVIPLIIRLKQRQEWGLMKGVIIGAVLTALLNGGCWLFLVGTFR
jgi:hypothetical protein